MSRSLEQLRRDAMVIWTAGVDAVRSDRLVRDNVRVEGEWLYISDQSILLGAIGRIEVVGAGKAGAGMAAGLEAALGQRVMHGKQLDGWIHVPADCVRKLEHIHLHAARPAGMNEPTAEGVAGSREILRRVATLKPNDLCIALDLGRRVGAVARPDRRHHAGRQAGGDALLQRSRRADRRLESRPQGSSATSKEAGSLAQCGAGQLITLVISDVLGDPLDLIASGPTVDGPGNEEQAIEILRRYGAEAAGIHPRVFAALERRSKQTREPVRARVVNRVVGNNRVAVEAAAAHAQSLGYVTQTESAMASEGAAEDVGRRLAKTALAMLATPGADCLISGGEPTVTLVESSDRGKGGRNQQLVLAAGEALRNSSPGVLILSGGTDGEDGPTDAAGTGWTPKFSHKLLHKDWLSPTISPATTPTTSPSHRRPDQNRSHAHQRLRRPRGARRASRAAGELACEFLTPRQAAKYFLAPRCCSTSTQRRPMASSFRSLGAAWRNVLVSFSPESFQLPPRRTCCRASPPVVHAEPSAGAAV